MQNEEKFRIKFFSKSDLSLYIYFEQALPILDTFSPEKDYDINEILELYNIKLILEAVDCPKNMNAEQFTHYQNFIKPINSLIGKYFNSFAADTFVPVLRNVEYEYVDDYLTLLTRFKVIQRIGQSDVTKALDEISMFLQDILQQEAWVKQFDSEISAYMLQSKQSAEIIIHHYLEEHESMKVVFYIPKTLSANAKIEILNRYIDNGHYHPNYVDFIAKGKSTDELPIDAKLRLKAQNAVEKYWKENSAPGTFICLSAQSSFEYIRHIREIQVDGPEAIYKFSKKWIDEHHDFPTLVWNLTHLFTFVDAQGRCTFISKMYDIATERYLGNPQGKDWYQTSFAFGWQQKITTSQIGAYCNILKEYDIEIEDLFEWFFNEYMEQKFGVLGFHYNKPSKQSTLHDKCRSLGQEVEGLLLQYKLYQENGEIDSNLLKFINEPLNVGELKSLQIQKYVYGKSGNFGREINSMLRPDLLYGTAIDLDKYQNFVQFLVAQKAHISDFGENAQKHIQWLIERKAISDNKGLLELNEVRYKVLKDLYDNQVASWFKSPPENRAVLQDLIDKDEVDVGATLFSDLERDYYNFVMNHKFSNGLNLRNKFAHGLVSNEANLNNEYLELLKIFILVLIKINEEFEVKFG